VVTLSMDGFHKPRAHRYRRGRQSAVGYYEDAYDWVGFVTQVLVPLGPGGSGRYRPRVHDLVSDQLVDEDPLEAPADALVLVDGSFLQRPEMGPVRPTFGADVIVDNDDPARPGLHWAGEGDGLADPH
jgi:uridine kinase